MHQRLLGLFPYSIDMAVPVFMIISGYVLSKSYITKGVLRFEDAYNLTIISKRLLRYIIPFLMAYMIELLYLYIHGNKMGIINIFSGFFTGGDGPGAYYYPEMIQITFILPIILFSMYEKPLGGLIFWFLFNAFYELIKTIVGLDQGIYRLSIFRYTFLIACGCFIYLQKNKSISKIYLKIAFIIGFIYIFITKYLGFQTRIINNDWKGTSFMAALYIAPIIMMIIYKFDTLSFKPIEIVGKASYNIFLTQLVYYYTISGAIIRVTNNILLRVIFNIFICVFVGIIFYLIENKITKKITSWVNIIIDKIKLSIDIFAE